MIIVTLSMRKVVVIIDINAFLPTHIKTRLTSLVSRDKVMVVVYVSWLALV